MAPAHGRATTEGRDMKTWFYIYCEPINNPGGLPHYRKERFRFVEGAAELMADLYPDVGHYWRMTVQEHESPPRGWKTPFDWNA